MTEISPGLFKKLRADGEIAVLRGRSDEDGSSGLIVASVRDPPEGSGIALLQQAGALWGELDSLRAAPGAASLHSACSRNLRHCWLLRVLIAFASILLAVSKSAAEPNTVDESYFARTWLAEDGLPDNRVVGMAQSPDGFLWVATQSGVVRFDGVQFRQARLAGDPKLLLGTTRLLMSDRQGRIWLAKEGGVIARIDGAQVRIWTIDKGLPKSEIQSSIAIDGDGSVWIAGIIGDLIHIDKGGNVAALTVKDGLPPGNDPCYLASGRDGKLWFAKGGEVGVYRDGRFNVLKSFGAPVLQIASAHSGGIWVCLGQRVLKVNEVVGGIETVNFGQIAPAEAGEKSNGQPSNLFEDETGALWVGTKSAGLFRSYRHSIVQVEVPNPDILSLAEDGEGDLWVGTRGGLSRVHRRVPSVIGPPGGPDFWAIQSVCEDLSGALWAVGEKGALMRSQGTKWIAESPSNRDPQVWVKCVAACPDGSVWIGVRGGALYHWKDGQFEDIGIKNELHGKSVRSLLVTSRGDLWIGTDAPDILFRLRGHNLRSFALPRGYRIIRTMTEDSAGNFWAGGSDGLLVRVSGDTLENETARPATQSIRCLHGAANGDIWIGYAGGGVGRLRNGSLVQFTTEQGLPNDYVAQILTDKRGNVWFAGNEGVFRVSERDFDDVANGVVTRVSPIVYGRTEGMSGLQASFDYFPNALRSSDGQRLYFSMLTGLAEIQLDDVRLNQAPPPVCIERVSVDDRIFADYENNTAPANGALNPPESKGELQFPPGSQRVNIEFTALSFAAPENVQFRYQLEGFDENWVDAGRSRIATYVRPPPGHYRFRVIACNSEGVWNEEGDGLAVTFEPYVWQTRWFKSVVTLVILVVALAAMSLILGRQHRRAVERLENLRAIEIERIQNARLMTMAELGASIAHEVSQPLAGVVTNAFTCIRWLERDSPNLQAACDATRRIIRDAKRGCDVIERIRAVLKKEETTNERLNVNDVIRETIALVEPKLDGVSLELDLAREIPSVFGDQVELQQVLHNLITNAIQAMKPVTDRRRRLRIYTRDHEGREVLIGVEDSGIGLNANHDRQLFEPFYTTKPEGLGLGLSICRSIVESRGGRIWATANDGPGATFQFTLSTHFVTAEHEFERASPAAPMSSASILSDGEGDPRTT